MDASIAAAKWLAGADAASIAQAQRVADIVDRAEEIRVELRAHTLLSRILGEMGLTPRVRTQLELRARKLATPAPDADASPAANVTPIASKRPEKRRR